MSIKHVARLILLIFFLSSTAVAQYKGTNCKHAKYKDLLLIPCSTAAFAMTLTLGADFIKQGDDETITIIAPLENTYTAKGDQTRGEIGGFIGVEYPLGRYLRGQFGIGGYVSQKLSYEGDVWQFADPDFDNFSYHYYVRHRRFVVEGKLLTTYKKIHPYLSANMGAAINTATTYQETPLIPTAVPMAPFTNRSTTSFTYGGGVGFEVGIDPESQYRIGIGYQYANLGSAQLGKSSVQTSDETLGQDNIFTSQVRLQFSYVG